METVGINTSNASMYANKNKGTNGSSLDKDAFLQLLVTQMKYQDPLEPTSNTEYMSQLAQFSTLEEMQNLGHTFTQSQAMSLAGQYVIMNVPDAAGNYSSISGLVDYVTMSNGDALLSINDQYYSIQYLDSVVSLDYLEYLARQLAGESTASNDNAAAGDNGAVGDNTTTE